MTAARLTAFRSSGFTSRSINSSPHPDIRRLVERIDILRWGHAMIEPRPNFIWSDARRSAAKPLGAVHFANTDLSGMALMEEAFFHGVRAADEVLANREQLSSTARPS